VSFVRFSCAASMELVLMGANELVLFRVIDRNEIDYL
jgi:hypothetical protein